MSDTIYRQDAINVLEKLSACEEYGVEVGTDEETYIGKYEAITAISDLPSADRPQGEWIAVASYSAFGGSEEQWYAHGNPTAYHYCSVCKEQVHLDEFGEEMLTNFCPNCGARMKGADDEA